MRSLRPLLTFLLLCSGLSAVGCSDGNNVNLRPAGPTGPTTWTLQAGSSSMQEAFQGLNFYPATLTVDAGDTVQWKFPSGEPHTVTIAPAGTQVPPPNDPSAPVPAGGTTIDGTTYTSSGFKLLGGTYALKFTVPGTYVYSCIIHPAMIGTVVVKPTGSLYAVTQAAYDALGATGITADLDAANASVATFPYASGGTHLAAGISPPLANGHPAAASVVRYLNGPALSDAPVTIAVGTTITWTNLSNNLPHTVSLGAVGQPFPTIAPPGAPTSNTIYDGTTFTNSGNIFPGGSYSLTFATRGTFVVHCIYHDDTEHMVQTIVVQ